jgi:predicted amidophosphoribosyltransferase
MEQFYDICVKCQKNMATDRDPFLTIIDTVTQKEISMDLCSVCIEPITHCMKCNRKYEEPWETVYFDMKNNFNYGYSCCFNKN